MIPPVTGLDTVKATRKALKGIVKGRKDYVYPKAERGRCLYVHDGKPDCLIAVLLAEHGASLTWLSWHDGKESAHPARMLCRDLGLPEEVGGYLSAVQLRQDQGYAWGRAIKG